MKKAILTLEFDSAAAMYEAVARLTGNDVRTDTSIQIVIPERTALDAATAVGTGAPKAEETKRERKPRSDRGQARGAYAPRDDNTAAPEKAAAAASGESATAPAGNATPAPAESASTAGGTTSPGPVSTAAEPTYEDARAALKRINDTKGLGTPTCIGHLQSYGVNRISDLPKEKYAEFIKSADDLVAKQAAVAK